jgi:hypothetical protein
LWQTPLLWPQNRPFSGFTEWDTAWISQTVSFWGYCSYWMGHRQECVVWVRLLEYFHSDFCCKTVEGAVVSGVIAFLLNGTIPNFPKPAAVIVSWGLNLLVVPCFCAKLYARLRTWKAVSPKLISFVYITHFVSQKTEQMVCKFRQFQTPSEFPRVRLPWQRFVWVTTTALSGILKPRGRFSPPAELSYQLLQCYTLIFLREGMILYCRFTRFLSCHDIVMCLHFWSRHFAAKIMLTVCNIAQF